MCVGCVHRHGVVKLVALVVRERRRRSGPLGSRPLVLGGRVHGLRHRRGLGVGLVFSAGLLLSRGCDSRALLLNQQATVVARR